ASSRRWPTTHCSIARLAAATRATRRHCGCGATTSTGRARCALLRRESSLVSSCRRTTRGFGQVTLWWAYGERLPAYRQPHLVEGGRHADRAEIRSLSRAIVARAGTASRDRDATRRSP